MFVPKDSIEKYTKENVKGGKGTIDFVPMFPDAQMPPKCKMFTKVTIEKGDSIGEHVHEGDWEFYYVLSCQGVTVEDGEEILLRPGDLTLTGRGHSHSLENREDQPLTVVAVILED